MILQRNLLNKNNLNKRPNKSKKLVKNSNSKKKKCHGIRR